MAVMGFNVGGNWSAEGRSVLADQLSGSYSSARDKSANESENHCGDYCRHVSFLVAEIQTREHGPAKGEGKGETDKGTYSPKDAHIHGASGIAIRVRSPNGFTD
jgi:hypothetical protein